MTQRTPGDFSIARLSDAAARLSESSPFDVIFQDGADLSVELYKPVGEDKQSPHKRAELYIIAAGSGSFNLDGDTFAFSQGDLIYVPARKPHRFETFSEDFVCWVIFYGADK